MYKQLKGEDEVKDKVYTSLGGINNYEEILCVIGWSALLKTKVCKRLYLFVNTFILPIQSKFVRARTLLGHYC